MPDPNGGTGGEWVGAGEATFCHSWKQAKAQWQLCIVALPSDGPRGTRQHERDYGQLWPLRTALPFVTTFSIFGLFALMNKFALYQSIYCRITLAGSTPSQRSTLYLYLGARATSSVVPKRRIVYRYWILPAHQALFYLIKEFLQCLWEVDIVVTYFL